jgi:hypothetical protein
LPLYHGPHIKVYQDPVPGHVYTVSTDVSEGVMGDYSTAVVVDVTFTPYRVVAVYKSNEISTQSLPNVVMNIAQTYNNALVMVETTGCGQEVANILWGDLEYEYMAMTENSTRIGQKLAGMFGGLTTRVGLNMNVKSKALGNNKLKVLIEADQLLIPDTDVVEELKRYAVKNKSFAAEEGHDDLVMSLVSFAWMVDQNYLKDLTSSSARETIAQNNAKKIEEDLTPAAMYRGHDLPKNAQLAVDPNDDSWILDDEEKYWNGRIAAQGPPQGSFGWALKDEKKKQAEKGKARNILRFW